MKKLLSAFFVVLALMVVSNSVFAQFNPRPEDFKGVSFGGFGEGMRMVGEVTGGTQENWQSLAGTFEDDLMAEQSQYSGNKFIFKIIDEEKTFGWNGLVYKEVPLRSVHGVLTILGNYFHEKIVVEGTFDIVQDLKDSNYQKRYGKKTVIIEAWMKECVVTGLETPKEKIKALKEYFNADKLRETVEQENFTISTNLYPSDHKYSVSTISYQDKEISKAMYQTNCERGNNKCFVKPQLKTYNLPDGRILLLLTYDVGNNSRKDIDANDRIFVVDKLTGASETIDYHAKEIFEPRVVDNCLIKFLSSGSLWSDDVFLTSTLLKEPRVTDYISYSQTEIEKVLFGEDK